MDVNPPTLLDLAFDALVSDDAARPSGMDERVLHAVVHTVRPARDDAWDVTGTFSSHDAFVRTASSLGELLDELTTRDWEQTTGVSALSVRELVAHLAGVERYILGQLGRGPVFDAPRREDHLAVSQRATPDLASETATATSRAWWSGALDVIATTAWLGPHAPVEYHHLAGDVRGLLVIRTFELWTHGDDIRRATGRPLDDLDEERMSLMVDELVRVLPFGMALEGTARPGATAQFRLTGAGGGTFAVALAPEQHAGDPDVTITASAADVCRLAANRVPVDALEMHVEGDRSLVEPILVGATAFACD